VLDVPGKVNREALFELDEFDDESDENNELSVWLTAFSAARTSACA
jgi:hypothetical protein